MYVYIIYIYDYIYSIYRYIWANVKNHAEMFGQLSSDDDSPRPLKGPLGPPLGPVPKKVQPMKMPLVLTACSFRKTAEGGLFGWGWKRTSPVEKGGSSGLFVRFG